MKPSLPQCLSTNSVPRAFFPQVATGCRLSLKIDRNLLPFWAGTLSVATWYNTGWIEGTASGEYLYRSVGSPAYLQASDSDYTPIRGQLRSSKDSFGRQSSFSYWSLQWEPKSHDVHSAKLLQLSGKICRSTHALLRHTNDSDPRRRNIFTKWLLETDHMTVSTPTIRFFSNDPWNVTKYI